MASSSVTIGLDSLADQITNQITIVEYAEYAMKNGAELDYRPAIIAASSARTLSQLALAHIRPELVHEIERFSVWNGKALRTLEAFWKNFRVVVLKNVDTGEEKIVQITQTAPAKPILRPTSRERQPNMTDKQIHELAGWFSNFARTRKKPTWAQMRQKGSDLGGYSQNTIYNKWQMFVSGQWPTHANGASR